MYSNIGFIKQIRIVTYNFIAEEASDTVLCLVCKLSAISAGALYTFLNRYLSLMYFASGLIGLSPSIDRHAMVHNKPNKSHHANNFFSENLIHYFLELILFPSRRA